MLETARLILRDFMEEDWVSVHPYCSDDEVTTYTFWGPNSEEQTKDFIKENIRSQYCVPRVKYEFAIIEKSTSILIGNCCINLQGTNAELGYCMARHYWGNGYATEASKVLLLYGFKQLGVHRIFATCRPQNDGSARVMEKIGMKKEGHLREHFHTTNGWQDSFVYSILVHEFNE